MIAADNRKVTADGIVRDDRGRFAEHAKSEAGFDLQPAQGAPEPHPVWDIDHDTLAQRIGDLSPGSSARASRDADPVVRALALGGWDLPDADRERLHSDPQVRRVLAILQED